ncbi:MAG TPA: carboxypeptidase regulatory-like domain-containing protein, partial [Acidimicrobiales bacterium]|nr:carboxypeptidase regulatory-like domain-containing protein [Acidimicrobiales bacterium]
AITAGPLHTCALLDTGAVKCWGESLHGRLGLGDTEDRGDGPGEMGDTLPTVDLGTGHTATAITAGSSHTCALLDDDTVKCWGYNTHGNLGVGDTAAHIGEGDAHPAAALLGSALAGHIRGTGGEALAGGLVAALRMTDYSVAGGGRADSTGMYGFALPPGTYYVYGIEPTGSYSPGFHGDPYEITIGTGTTVAGPTLSPREGTIAGRVTDAGTGDPIPGALTMSLTALGGPEESATTDGDGDFTLPGMRAGPHYLVSVDLTGAHAPRFHLDAPDILGADVATASAGATTVSDGELPAQAPAGTATAIVGDVTDTAGRPLPAILVAALRADTFSLARATRTNAGGGYALALDPGSYRIGFIDPTGGHEREGFDDQPVDRLDLSVPVTAPGTADATL